MLDRALEGVGGQDEDAGVEEVEKILQEVRQEFDETRAEVIKREKEVKTLRELIRARESTRGEEARRSAGEAQATQRANVQRQLDDAQAQLEEARQQQKVYKHVLERSRRERLLMQQKVDRMEQHLERKKKESQQREAVMYQLQQQRETRAQDLEGAELDVGYERQMRGKAVEAMTHALNTTKLALKRRQDFEVWRRGVAQDAANAAFQRSAGKLRKIWAMEKLAGNCLQKIIYDQVEKSQATEEGFQKIREVTGLTDVMDIVHKFLNRDVEHEQLKQAVKETEQRLEALRTSFDQLKNSEENIMRSGNQEDDQLLFSVANRQIYFDLEERKSDVQRVTSKNQTVHDQLDQARVNLEFARRWALRIGASLKEFDDRASLQPESIVTSEDLAGAFQSLRECIQRFVGHVKSQLQSGQARRGQLQGGWNARDYHEHSRLLNDADFLRVNCRVPSLNDAGDDANDAGIERTEEQEEESAAVVTERQRVKEDAAKREEEGKRLVAGQQAKRR